MSAVSPVVDEEHGPAMRACDVRERAFVLAFVAAGGKDAQGAARAAGYAPGGTDETLKVQGHRLRHRERVLAAIREVTLKSMHSCGPEMFGVLLGIARDEKASAKDRRSAANDVLDRIGLHAVHEQRVTVEDNRDRGQLLEELLGLLKAARLPAGPPMIDVTPEPAGGD